MKRNEHERFKTLHFVRFTLLLRSVFRIVCFNVIGFFLRKRSPSFVLRRSDWFTLFRVVRFEKSSTAVKRLSMREKFHSELEVC